MGDGAPVSGIGTESAPQGAGQGASGQEAPAPEKASPPLAARVASVTALLNVARQGDEADLVQQLETRLTQLKEAQQAERPLAARYQSAVDRAKVKKAASHQAEKLLVEAQAWLKDAEVACKAAAAAADEADDLLEQLQQQLGEEAAGAGKAGDPATPRPHSLGSLVGDLHALAVGGLSSALSDTAQRELEAALTSLNRVQASLRTGRDPEPSQSTAGAGGGLRGTGDEPRDGEGLPRLPSRSASLASQRGCERATGDEPSRKAAKVGEEGAAAAAPGVSVPMALS